MILIVGLGNPGAKYKNTRHNIGWQVLDLLQNKWSFPNWRQSKKFKAEISQGKIENKKIILAKPLTFMNLSDQSVKSLTSFYKIKPKDLIVIHDDIDILIGKIKIVKNRGSAGHKGIQSIISNIRTKNFIRFRIGIKPKKEKTKETEKFVLQKFNKGEEKITKEVIQKTTEAIETAIEGNLEKAMSKFN